MFNSAILEVVVGLIFVFSLLAIIVTQINTVIVNILNLRARHLKGAMQALITDPDTQAKLLTHPLIRLVDRRVNPNIELSAQVAEAVVESDTSDVAWIQPSVFADVMIELITAQASDEHRELFAPLLRVGDTVLDNAEKVGLHALVRKLQNSGGEITELHTFILTLPDPADRQAMLTALAQVEVTMRQYRTSSGDLIALLRGVNDLQTESFRRALDTLLGAARTIEDAKLRLSRWFDMSMEHVTDTYRRRIQIISLGVGLLLAVLLNVDTLQMAQALWNDPALRDTVVLAAQSSINTGNLQAQVNEATAALAQAQAGDGTSTLDLGTSDLILETTPEPGDTPGVDTREGILELGESAARTIISIENLLNFRLPIGWYFEPIAAEDAEVLPILDPRSDARNFWNYLPGNNPADWFGLWLRKIIGLALTTIAVSQGAPFWFDLMNRIARGSQSA